MSARGREWPGRRSRAGPAPQPGEHQAADAAREQARQHDQHAPADWPARGPRGTGPPRRAGCRRSRRWLRPSPPRRSRRRPRRCPAALVRLTASSASPLPRRSAAPRGRPRRRAPGSRRRPARHPAGRWVASRRRRARRRARARHDPAGTGRPGRRARRRSRESRSATRPAGRRSPARREASCQTTCSSSCTATRKPNAVTRERDAEQSGDQQQLEVAPDCATR